MAAGLYTPPAPTFDPASATPTAVVTTASGLPLTPTGISISGLMLSTTTTTAASSGVSGSVVVVSGSSGSAEITASGSNSGSHHSGSDAAATAGLDTHSSTPTGSPQFGNPIAGNLNTDDTPIIPSGIGYNSGNTLSTSLLFLCFLLISIIAF
ncbi:hypothetical protein IWW47_000554 [Coemansia sp. RSA 2052]|nr:hypothetical protein IWW47_000554 [Coemansia sp. RSA 2052]